MQTSAPMMNKRVTRDDSVCCILIGSFLDDSDANANDQAGNMISMRRGCTQVLYLIWSSSEVYRYKCKSRNCKTFCFLYNGQKVGSHGNIRAFRWPVTSSQFLVHDPHKFAPKFFDLFIEMKMKFFLVFVYITPKMSIIIPIPSMVNFENFTISDTDKRWRFLIFLSLIWEVILFY